MTMGASMDFENRVRGELVAYSFNDATYEAYVVHAPKQERQPCIVVAHHWAGLTGEIRSIAEAIADEGYLVVAIDVYGIGRRGATPEECSALMNPLLADRRELANRIRAGVDFAKSLPGVDENAIGAVGYCFGGLCVLDMARMNLGVKAVTSIHGVLKSGDGFPEQPIVPRILILHGDSDPFAPRPDELEIRQELSARNATWEIHAYGHAMHAFTVRGLSEPGHGLEYHPVAAKRAWAAMLGFMKENLQPLGDQRDSNLRAPDDVTSPSTR